jgi:Carboxypeptidase regulatory-like domain
MRAMRRLITGAFVLLWSLGAGAAHAAPKGVIEGTVVNGATGKPQPGVEVTLVGARQDGGGSLQRTATTSRTGAYEFMGLPTGDDRLYAIDATYAGGLFAGRAVSIPSDSKKTPVIETTLRVWDTTTDPAAILVRRNDVFVVPDAGRAGVVESVTVVNPTDLAYIGRGAEAAGGGSSTAPSLGFALPPGASERGVRVLDSDLDIPRLVNTDFGFGVTVAIPPGESRITYTYELPGGGGSFDVSRSALYSIGEFSIYAADPLEVESNRLDGGETVDIDGTTYRRWATRDSIDPGDPVQAVATARAGMEPGLVAGIAGVLVLVVVVGLIAYRRARKHRSIGVPVEASRPSFTTRAEVVETIAALDVSFQAGSISESEWRTRRNQLKDELREFAPEPAQ